MAGDGPAQHPVLGTYLHPSSGYGILTAAAAALRHTPGERWVQAMDSRGVTAGERRALRSVLLQVIRNHSRAWGVLRVEDVILSRQVICTDY